MDFTHLFGMFFTTIIELQYLAADLKLASDLVDLPRLAAIREFVGLSIRCQDDVA
jgi:hypothetical protein